MGGCDPGITSTYGTSSRVCIGHWPASGVRRDGLAGQGHGPALMQLFFQVVFPLGAVMAGSSTLAPDARLCAGLAAKWTTRMAAIAAKGVSAGNTASEAVGLLTDRLDWTFKALVGRNAQQGLGFILKQHNRPVYVAVAVINATRMIHGSAAIPLTIEFITGRQRIAWCQDDPDGRNQIWMMYDDRDHKAQVTRGDHESSSPAFPPDGTKLAFCSNREPERGRRGSGTAWLCGMTWRATSRRAATATGRA
ncbi:MAG: hypothetical protein GF320_20380 [Armatimonadia bacterium]|nr:hypothetical protein [Armatimonadia bacterium]